MNWEIFLGIVAIVGFLITICGPIIKLTNSITRLNMLMDSLQTTLNNTISQNQQYHDKTDNEIKDIQKDITKIEKRVTRIELQVDIAPNDNSEE